MSKFTGPLDDGFILPLGRVTANYAVLESQLEYSLWALIGRDQRLGQIITAELSLRAKVALFSAVFRHRVTDPLLIAECESVLNRVQLVEDQRNQVVHSQWGPGDTPTTRTRIKVSAKKGKGIRHVFEQTTPQQIDEIAEAAGVAAFDIFALMGKLPDEMVGRVRVTI